jgi:hypothetical protein
MTALVAVAVIADAIVLFALATYASADRRNFIDEHQGDGSIRDDWALDCFDAAVRATRLRQGSASR